jgi:hypothetical protein
VRRSISVVVAADERPVPALSSPADFGPSTSQSRPRRSVGFRPSARLIASSNACVLRWYACIALPASAMTC